MILSSLLGGCGYADGVVQPNMTQTQLAPVAVTATDMSLISVVMLAAAVTVMVPVTVTLAVAVTLALNEGCRHAHAVCGGEFHNIRHRFAQQ